MVAVCLNAGTESASPSLNGGTQLMFWEVLPSFLQLFLESFQLLWLVVLTKDSNRDHTK